MGKDYNFKWALILALVGLCAILGFYLRGMSEEDLNRFLVKWLSIALLVLVVSAVLIISVLWNKANGEMRFREGSESAMRARIYPSSTPYRSCTPPMQGYGDWPAPPPPERGPVLKMLPDGLLADMNDTWND